MVSTRNELTTSALLVVGVVRGYITYYLDQSSDDYCVIMHVRSMFLCCLKKNLNASKPSEHPLDGGGISKMFVNRWEHTDR